MRDDAAKGEGLAPSPGPLPKVPPRPRAFLEWEARVAASKRPMPPFTVSWDESGRYFVSAPGGAVFLSFPPDAAPTTEEAPATQRADPATTAPAKDTVELERRWTVRGLGDSALE